MTEQLAGLSPWWPYLSLFVLVFVRVQVVYWVARLAGEGARTRRFGQRLEGPRVQRAEELLNRYGPPAVTVSLITPGVQSAVNALAGVSKMPFGRYLAAMTLGCAAWAVVYTVGFLAVWAWITTLAGSPLGALALAAVVVAAVLLVRIAVRRRRARQNTHDAEGTSNEPSAVTPEGEREGKASPAPDQHHRTSRCARS